MVDPLPPTTLRLHQCFTPQTSCHQWRHHWIKSCQWRHQYPKATIPFRHRRGQIRLILPAYNHPQNRLPEINNWRPQPEMWRHLKEINFSSRNIWDYLNQFFQADFRPNDPWNNSLTLGNSKLKFLRWFINPGNAHSFIKVRGSITIPSTSKNWFSYGHCWHDVKSS